MKLTALLTIFVAAVASAQQTPPTTGYAPVNGLKMYYEVHGAGDPVVLLHGSFMTITNNWSGWVGELSKTRRVIAVEMQGHGRTADIPRDFSYQNLADDIAGLLDYLKVPSADLIGYSLGGGVAMQCAIRHPEKIRRVVCISAVFRHDGWVREALDVFPQLTSDAFKDSPIEAEYKKLSPTPDEFPNFVKRVIAADLKPYDFGADKLRATKAPMFFIHGDADGVRLEHIAEMFRLKGEEIFGDLRPRSASRLAVLPNTTHVGLMERMPVIVPMVNEFLDAAAPAPAAESKGSAENRGGEKALRVHYLEIVTPSVNQTCDTLEKAHGATFGKPIAELGNARTAELTGGGRIGVRAPMRETEAPVVRPYVLVDDIQAAVRAVEAAGGQFAVTPTEIPGHGTFAIYVLGGIDHGLWQLGNRR